MSAAPTNPSGRPAPNAAVKDDVFVEAVYSELYKTIGLCLRVEKATEGGLGAVLISSSLQAPPAVRALPPYQYMVWMIGNNNVSMLPFTEVDSRLKFNGNSYPVTILFKKIDRQFKLLFPPPSQKLHLKIIQNGNGGQDDPNPPGGSSCKIVEYIRPFKFGGDVPTLAMGHHLLDSINGRSLTGVPYISVVEAIRTASFPLEITVRLEPNQDAINKARADAEIYDRMQLEACRTKFLTCACSHCETIRILLGNASVFTDQVYP